MRVLATLALIFAIVLTGAAATVLVSTPSQAASNP
jgi:hypothetical protein